MAQVLKEEIRNKILLEARSEFYQLGYQVATLRSIASKAGITVGNLYRYYEGKEHLYEASVQEAYQALNNIIDERTNHTFALSSNPEENNFTSLLEKDAHKIIADVLLDLEEIFSRYHQELIILLKESHCLSDDSRFKMRHWFERLFRQIYPEMNFPIYIASGFLESIVNAAEQAEANQTEALTEIVHFYLLKGGADR